VYYYLFFTFFNSSTSATWHLTNGMWVSRQQRLSQQWGGGPKLPRNQNIRVCFVFKLVKGP